MIKVSPNRQATELVKKTLPDCHIMQNRYGYLKYSIFNYFKSIDFGYYIMSEKIHFYTENPIVAVFLQDKFPESDITLD